MLLFPVHLVKGKKWKRAVEFEENPRTMSFWDIVHFAYKYYYSSPVLPSLPEYDHHFKEKYTATLYPESASTISIGGDLMPYEMIKPEHTSGLWDEIGADFFGSDLVFANLETPLDITQASSFVPEVMLNDMHFNTDMRTFKIFSGDGKYKGFDVLSVANNHSLDMGIEGLDATMRFLKDKSVDYVGAKLDKAEKDFVIKDLNGIKVGIVAYTYSLNQMLPPQGLEWKVNLLPLNRQDVDIQLILDQVKSCREAGAEFIICSMHCGNAYQPYPSACTIELFQKIFETCGVDLIAGGHPHNLQPWREYIFKDPLTGNSKKGFAIYSLADFIAYDIYTWCHLSAYLKVRLWREEGLVMSSVEVKPLIMTRQNAQLKLRYAQPLMEQIQLNGELKDIKVLYDAVVTGM